MAKMRKRCPRGKRGKARVQRSPQLGVVVQRRTLSLGNLAKGAVDQGFQLGITPSGLPDWTSLQAVWKRFRLLGVVINFVNNGEYDTTPAPCTLVVSHDVTSTGVPASLVEAMSLKGKRMLQFNQARNMQRFPFTPLVWTSGALSLTVPSAGAYAPLSSGPAFTSAVGWGINYNTAGGTPNIVVLVEMLIEFSYPQ